MRRDVRRHPHSDTARAVDQQVRILGWQNHRLLLRTIIVVLEINSVFVDIGEQILRRLLHPRFGVAHRSWWIIVDGSEIPLTIDQRQAHREWLRHPHQGVINRAVPVWVEVPHHGPDNVRRLLVGLIRRVSVDLHCIENAAVNRLQAIAHIWQSATDDHAHRIVEIRAFQLGFDAHGIDAVFPWNRRHFWIFWRCRFVAHGALPLAASTSAESPVFIKKKTSRMWGWLQIPSTRFRVRSNCLIGAKKCL